MRFVTFSKRSNLWTDICSKMVKLLDHRHIKHTSIDFVRFCREEQDKNGLVVTVTSRVTIWVGVRPDSTNGDTAFDSTQDIFELLREHHIDDINIAYRKSEAHPLAGPILYAPVNDFHPLKSVIDWVMTSLSLPIAGLKTHHMQGALGFYFKIGEDLYSVTARHVLFPDTDDTYYYDTCAFIASVSFQKISGILTTLAQLLQRRISSSWATEHSKTFLSPFRPLLERQTTPSLSWRRVSTGTWWRRRVAMNRQQWTWRSSNGTWTTRR